MRRFQPAKRTRAPISLAEYSSPLAAQLTSLQAEIRKTVPLRFVGEPAKEWLLACLQCLHDTAKWSCHKKGAPNKVANFN